MPKIDFDNLDVEIKNQGHHRCCACGVRHCNCKGIQECWLCAKCRRIRIDGIPVNLEGFSLLSGAPDKPTDNT